MEFLVNSLHEALELVQQVAFRVHSGGGGHGPGLVGWIDHFLTRLNELGHSDLSDILLPGFTEIGNIHPILVHFPIALLSCFVAAELFATVLKNENLRIAASWMLYLGTLGAMATVFTGFLAAQSVAHSAEVHEVILKHKAFGLTVLGLSLCLSLWRLLSRARFSPVGSGIHLLLGIVMLGVMLLGADLGGLMVYKYGVNVQAAQQPMDHEHDHDGAHAMDAASEPVQARTQAPAKVPKKAHEHVHANGVEHHH